MINLSLYKLGLNYNRPKEIVVYEETAISEQYKCERAYIKPRETPTSTKIRYGKKEYTFVKAEYPLQNLPRFLVSVKNNELDFHKKVLDQFIYLKTRYEEIIPETGEEIVGYVAKFNLEHPLDSNTFISKKNLYNHDAKENENDFSFQRKFVPFFMATAKYNVFNLIHQPKIKFEIFPATFSHKAGVALESYFSDTVIMRAFQKRYLLRTYRVRKGAFWVFIRLLSKIISRLNSVTLVFEKKKRLVRVLKKLLIWANILKWIIKKVYRMLKISVYRRKLSIGKHFRKFIFSIPYQKVLNLKKLSIFFKVLNKLRPKKITIINCFNDFIIVNLFCFFKFIFFHIFFKFISRLCIGKKLINIINIKNFNIVKGTRVKVADHLPEWFFDNFVIIKRILFIIKNILKLRARKLKSIRVLKKKLQLRKKGLLICQRKKFKFVTV